MEYYFHWMDAFYVAIVFAICWFVLFWRQAPETEEAVRPKINDQGLSDTVSLKVKKAFHKEETANDKKILTVAYGVILFSIMGIISLERSRRKS